VSIDGIVGHPHGESLASAGIRVTYTGVSSRDRGQNLVAKYWPPKIAGMDEPVQLQHAGHWRMAVWALRAGYVGLAVALVGLIVMLAGSTPWVLAVGEIIWLAAAVVTLTGFFWARHELPEPRPGYWSMRFMLIRDSVHARSSAQRS